MAKPLVTVVVPAYNAGDYLGDCLQSIADQSFENFTCKIYDDGSTDNTSMVAKTFVDRDVRFQYIKGTNLGTPKRVAGAYRDIASEFFCQVDADDKIHKDALSITTRILSRCPENIGVVYSDYQRMNSDGTIDSDDPHFISRCRQTFSLKRMQTMGFCAFQFRLIRTSSYSRSLGIDTSLPTGEDFDLVLKLSEVCQFVHVPKKLYFYRQHKEQTSRKNPTKLEYSCKQMMDKSIKRKSNASVIVALPYGGIDDAFAMRNWVQQQSSVPVLLSFIMEEEDPDILESREYSQHRVEFILRKEKSLEDSIYTASRMISGARTIAFEETLVPSPGVLNDLIADKSVPVFTLEPRTSWLLQAGTLQFDGLKDLSDDNVSYIGNGPVGTSALYRLTREGKLCL